MGLLDAIMAQQNGGLFGGLPASWQYNADPLTPAEQKMMALAGVQSPQSAGFNPLPPTAAPAGPPQGIIGLNSPFGDVAPAAAVAAAQAAALQNAAPAPSAPLAPAFGAGAQPIFATPPGAPGSLSAPAAAPPVVAASDDDDDETPAPAPAQASPIAVGGYQMPRLGPAGAFTPSPAALPANAQPAQGQVPPAAPASPGGGILQHIGAALNSVGAPNSLFHNVITNPVNALITGQTQADVAQANQAKIANVTAQALVNKGVSREVALAAIQPGNGELLKALWEANFKSKDPMNLGSGYVLRPGAAKAERLFTPDDKTPAGFTQAEDGTMHFTPGGPADPAYLRLAEVQKKDPTGNYVLGKGGAVIRNNPDGSVTEVYKNKAEDPVPMDPASLEILARREIGGDFSGRKNLGRGAQGAADLKAITNKSSEILTNEMGMTPAQAAEHLVKKQQEYNAQGQGLNAEARTTGVREANLNLILKAADAAIPAALEASDKVARTGWVPLNKVIQGGEVIASDPDLKKFGMANLQLAEHWARAMNPTGVMRESDRDKALSFLSTADSKETYKAAVGQLRTQIERERDAVKATRGMSDLPGSAAAPPAAAASSAPKEGDIAHNPSTGETIIRRNGKWEPTS